MSKSVRKEQEVFAVTAKTWDDSGVTIWLNDTDHVDLSIEEAKLAAKLLRKGIRKVERHALKKVTK